jgi:hypothetical protein
MSLPSIHAVVPVSSRLAQMILSVYVVSLHIGPIATPLKMTVHGTRSELLVGSHRNVHVVMTLKLKGSGPLARSPKCRVLYNLSPQLSGSVRLFVASVLEEFNGCVDMFNLDPLRVVDQGTAGGGTGVHDIHTFVALQPPPERLVQESAADPGQFAAEGFVATEEASTGTRADEEGNADEADDDAGAPIELPRSAAGDDYYVSDICIHIAVDSLFTAPTNSSLSYTGLMVESTMASLCELVSDALHSAASAARASCPPAFAESGRARCHYPNCMCTTSIHHVKNLTLHARVPSNIGEQHGVASLIRRDTTNFRDALKDFLKVRFAVLTAVQRLSNVV